MTYYTNECVDCEPQYASCGSCELKHTAHVKCDSCLEELAASETVYKWGGDDLCEECTKKGLLHLIKEDVSVGELITMLLDAGYDDLPK